LKIRQNKRYFLPETLKNKDISKLLLK